jgi:hypothetical protein
MYTTCQITYETNSGIKTHECHKERKPKDKQHYYKPFIQQNNIITITRDLSIYTITNWLHIKDVPPTYMLVNFFSTIDHP